MIPISEAVKIIERETPPLGTETVALAEAVRRVLAENISADVDLPPFDRSQMDGFAVRAADTETAPARLKIIGESIAGRGFDGELRAGEAVRIMTGARVPAGADAVQKVELTRENNGFIEILEPAKIKQNIVLRGEEIRRNTPIFRTGEMIGENMIASLASFGHDRVRVFRKPSISILSTGSEIVEIAQKPQKDQIRNSNSAMLQAFAGKLGLDAESLPLVHDDFKALKQTIAAAVGLNAANSDLRSEMADPASPIAGSRSHLLLITGGVSVGDYDFTKPALRELGAEFFFEKVSLKPGKPTVFAKLNNVLVFGLPGNPVSVAVTFYLFVRTAALKMQSALEFRLKRGFAVVSSPIKGARERDSVLPVSLATNENGQLVIEALRFSGSSNFVAFARAEALVLVPQGRTLEQGEVAEILFL